jgi:hypothetical protein
MLSFLNYIVLFEAKVDDLAAKYPDHAEAIKAFNKADPTPTKKFLPWLVKQHMAGNVSPDDARLSSTMANFDKVAHKLPAGKDHNNYDYNTLANHVGEHVEAEVKKKQGEQAIQKVYNDPKSGVTAQQIRTREASQKLYGGGPARGGTPGCERGTSWCVAARSKNNMFGSYGPTMYTIHDPNDDAAPYAVHPTNPGRGPVVTNRHNNGEVASDQFVQDHPHLRGPIQSILTHSAHQLPGLLASNDVNVVRGALAHPMIAKEHLARAANHSDPSIRYAVAQHPKATHQQISDALEDSDATVRKAAAMNPSATQEHMEKALNDKDIYVARGAVDNRSATPEFLMKAAQVAEKKDPEGLLRHGILYHPNVTDEVRERVLADQSNADNRRELMKSPNATPKQLAQGIKDSVAPVRREAARHPNLTPELIAHALNDEDRDVMQFAARHPNNTPETIDKALDDKSQYFTAAREAARHPNASPENLMKALKHPDRYTREHAAEHPNATPEVIEAARNDKDDGVREHVLRNPNISVDHISDALSNDPNHSVREQAIRQLLKRDPENEKKHVQTAVNDPHPQVRAVVIDNKAVTAKQLDHLSKTEDGWSAVRMLENPNVNAKHILNAIKRPNISSWMKEDMAKHKKADGAVIDAAMDHTAPEDYEVRRGAMKNKKATPEQIARGLQDPVKQVRQTALKNRNASYENLMQGLEDKLPTVRAQVLKSKNLHPDHIQKAANDKDKNVRAAAQALLLKK